MPIGSREMMEREPGIFSRTAVQPSPFRASHFANPIIDNETGDVSSSSGGSSFGGNFLKALPMLLAGPGAFGATLAGLNIAGGGPSQDQSDVVAEVQAQIDRGVPPQQAVVQAFKSGRLGQLVGKPGALTKLNALKEILTAPEPVKPIEVQQGREKVTLAYDPATGGYTQVMARGSMDAPQAPPQPTSDMQNALFAFAGDRKKAQEFMMQKLMAEARGETNPSVAAADALLARGTISQDMRDFIVTNNVSVNPNVPIPDALGRQIGTRTVVATPAGIQIIDEQGPMNVIGDEPEFEQPTRPPTGFEQQEGQGDLGNAVAFLGAGPVGLAQSAAGSAVRFGDLTIDLGLAERNYRTWLNQVKARLPALNRGGRDSEAAYKRLENVWASMGLLEDPRAALETGMMFRQMIESDIRAARHAMDAARTEQALNDASQYESALTQVLEVLPTYKQMENVRALMEQGKLGGGGLSGMLSDIEGAASERVAKEPTASSKAAELPLVSNKPDFDKLPAGARFRYVDPADGKTKTGTKN